MSVFLLKVRETVNPFRIVSTTMTITAGLTTAEASSKTSVATLSNDKQQNSYGTIVLTLENRLLSETKLELTDWTGKLRSICGYFMNGSFRTDVFVGYQPETIACACIYLTARKQSFPLPANPG